MTLARFVRPLLFAASPGRKYRVSTDDLLLLPSFIVK
jgi:hypothetical protein